VVITATSKSSAATPGKVTASVKPTDASLSIPKAGAASLRTAKPAATNRSTSEAATSAAHRTPSETAAAHRTTTTVHPAAPATTVATTTATLSHCWRSKRESEHQCSRSNRLEFIHRISPLLERQNSLLKLETF